MGGGKVGGNWGAQSGALGCSCTPGNWGGGRWGVIRNGEMGGDKEWGDGGHGVGLTWGALQRCPHGVGAALTAHLHCKLHLEKGGMGGNGMGWGRGLHPQTPLPGFPPPKRPLMGLRTPKFPFVIPAPLRVPRMPPFPLLFNGVLPPLNAVSRPLRPTKSHQCTADPPKRPLAPPHNPKPPFKGTSAPQTGINGSTHPNAQPWVPAAREQPRMAATTRHRP